MEIWVQSEKRWTIFEILFSFTQFLRYHVFLSTEIYIFYSFKGIRGPVGKPGLMGIKGRKVNTSLLFLYLNFNLNINCLLKSNGNHTIFHSLYSREVEVLLENVEIWELKEKKVIQGIQGSQEKEDITENRWDCHEIKVETLHAFIFIRIGFVWVRGDYS